MCPLFSSRMLKPTEESGNHILVHSLDVDARIYVSECRVIAHIHSFDDIQQCIRI